MQLTLIILALASQIAGLSIPSLKGATDPTTSGLSTASPSSLKATTSPKTSESGDNVLSIHGQNVTAICFEAYRSSFVKTLAVTDVVQALVKSTSSVATLKVSGLAAAKSAVSAQDVFSKLNEHLDAPLTDDDRASLLSARNEEVQVSVYIGLVINSMPLLNVSQKEMLDKFHIVAQAERVSRLLVEQSCPELAVEMSSR